MFTPGNILHGEFDLGIEKKEKFAIVLYNDGVDCILTTFTTSLYAKLSNTNTGGCVFIVEDLEII